jgi:hypothetical protein
MTVALGSAGNNLILGGKVAHLSAEDAYTVCMVSNVYSSVRNAHPCMIKAFDHARLWEGRRLRLPE